MKLGLIIDKRRCYGCQACTVSCKAENGTPPGVFWCKTYLHEHGTYPNAFIEYEARICNHCDNAPCVKVCPTGASMKMDDGTVQIDLNKCIGCEACVPACPYGSRYPIKESTPTYWETGKQTEWEKAVQPRFKVGTVSKCTFCVDRRRRGLLPACVQTCAGGARIFGDLDDPTSQISILMREENPKTLPSKFGARPNVFYIEDEKIKPHK
ncbi:4Fe-4S ferredoxin [Halarcobacter ebronensis]|uniref:4Fe-4S ferredoxin n=1 Tax=Halarcobacter ebronensis TaxID=1462615 RepID=A0A4Q0YIN1_9BACT|nr:4Fe-4S dicluster domain-containing protein [Halarcobacter ebronensis]RXJ70155.1 4Fe-4S ferredoxin [Halarcobacter ebronensis]